MSDNKRVRARYISDIPDEYLKKGNIYDCFTVELAGWLGYTDDHGEKYALPADRFEIIEERCPDIETVSKQ